jgi:hypothetical protein
VLRYASGDVALGINFAASNFEFWGAGSGTINAAMTRTVRATLNSTGIALGKATAPNYAVDATGDGYISLKLGVGIVPSAIATFQVAGSQSTSILSISANTTLDATHNTVIVPNGSAFTVTLPSASGITGRWYRIVNKTAGIITIGSYVNLLGTTVTTLGIATSIVVQSDGTNWQQIQ